MASSEPSALAANAPSPEAARLAAVKFLGSLAAELSAGSVDLPCFPDVVLRVREALADPRNTPARTVTIVGAEPRLAARLLQTANSAAFNPTGRPLTDLRSAVTRLGLQMVQSAAMAFAVQHMKDQAALRSIVDPLNQLWKRSIRVALISQAVARRTAVTPDKAFLTGLMHGIGRLYIMVRSLGRTGEFGEPGQFVGWVAGWQAGIGKAVLENWAFAEELSAAVGDQEAYDRVNTGEPDLTDVLIVSIVLADALEQPAMRSIDRDGICAFETLALSHSDCNDVLDQAEQQWAMLEDALG
jgi:HD-like signal output (HDOD) protein